MPRRPLPCPPLSILVMRPSPSRSGYEFMRLHLVVVDVNYHWATRNHGVRYKWPFLKYASPYCTPMACDRDSGAQPFCNERFAFGYARDNSTCPLFLLHPVREQGDTFTLISFFFFALCCLGKIPGGAPFSQLHKSGNGSRVDRP